MTNEDYQHLDYFQRRKPNILYHIHYFPNEVFAETPIFPNIIIGNFGTIIDKRNGMKIVSCLDPYGNPIIHTKYSTDNFDRRSLKIGKAILMAHNPIPNYEDYRAVHKDGNVLNNIYAPGTPWDNLFWIHKDLFTKYMIEVGLKKCNPKASVSSLSDEEIHAICRALSQGLNNRDVLLSLDMEDNEENRYKVVAIRSGNVRKDIVSQYSFPGPSKNVKHTENEVHTICRCLAQYKPLEYNLTQIRLMAEKELGHEIKRNFIEALYRRVNAKWKYITNQYNY